MAPKKREPAKMSSAIKKRIGLPVSESYGPPRARTRTKWTPLCLVRNPSVCDHRECSGKMVVTCANKHKVRITYRQALHSYEKARASGHERDYL